MSGSQHHVAWFLVFFYQYFLLLSPTRMKDKRRWVDDEWQDIFVDVWKGVFYSSASSAHLSAFFLFGSTDSHLVLAWHVILMLSFISFWMKCFASEATSVARENEKMKKKKKKKNIFSRLQVIISGASNDIEPGTSPFVENIKETRPCHVFSPWHCSLTLYSLSKKREKTDRF